MTQMFFWEPRKTSGFPEGTKNLPPYYDTEIAPRVCRGSVPLSLTLPDKTARISIDFWPIFSTKIKARP